MPELAAGAGIAIAKDASQDLIRISADILSGRLAYATYAELAADTARGAGTVAEIPTSDTGTHTDPVVGGTVNNTGIFRWSASPAGWQRLSDVDALSASGYAADAAASEAAAAASAASLTNVITPVTVGRPTASPPITGSASLQTYVFNTAMTGLTRITQVRVFALATGTLKLKVFELSGGLFKQVRSQNVTVPATGLQTLAVPNELLARTGEYVGFLGGNIVPFTSAAGDSGGWYQAVGDVQTVTQSGLNTTLRLQIGIDGERTTFAPKTYADQEVSEIAANVESRLGFDVTDANVDSGGAIGTPTNIGATTFVYGLSQVFSRRPVGVEINVNANGTGFIERISTANVILDSIPVTVGIGVNVFGEDTFAGMVDHPSWRLFYRTGGTARIRFGTSSNPDTVFYPTSTAGTVGNSVTLTTSNASLSFVVHAAGETIAEQIEALEDAIAGTTSTVEPRLLDEDYKVTLLTGTAWNHGLGYGQSNDLGADATPLLTDPASIRHKTFNVGPKMTKPGIAGGGNPHDGSTKALVEDLANPTSPVSGTYGQTLSLPFAKEVTRRLSYGQVPPLWFMSMAGKSSTVIANLGPASAWYQNLLYHVTAAKAAAVAAGVGYSVPVIFFDHGESDNLAATTKAAYQAAFVSLIDQFKIDYQAATGNTNSPIWLFTISTYNVQKTAGTAEAILELCRTRPDCMMVAPNYRFPQVNATHLSAAGQALKATYYARAVAEMVGGRVPSRIWWGAAVANGTTLTVYADGPTQLEFNTTVLGLATNYGMAVEDGTGVLTLSNIACGTAFADASGRLVTPITMTLNRALGANPVFRYAKDYLGAGLTITAGASGNLFDTTDETVTISGATYSLAHAAPPITQAITVAE